MLEVECRNRERERDHDGKLSYFKKPQYTFKRLKENERQKKNLNYLLLICVSSSRFRCINFRNQLKHTFKRFFFTVFVTLNKPTIDAICNF